MKKVGILFICLIVTIIVVLSSSSYAFFSSSQFQMDFTITSGSGSVLSLELSSSENELIPASTSADIDTYSAVAGETGSYATYVLQYTSSSSTNIDVTFSFTNMSFINSEGVTLNRTTNGLALYLIEVLKYSYVLTDSIDSGLPTPGTWISDSESTTFTGITTGSGYLILYIKINVTQEEIPDTLDGVKISFTINTEISSV